MALRDEIKAERKAFLKDATFKQKLAYFWDYYKVHTIIITIVIVAASNFIYHQITDPEVILNGMFLNTFGTDAEVSITDHEQLFFEAQGIDTSEYIAEFSDTFNITGDDATDYEMKQAIFVRLASGSVDFLVSPVNHIMDYAYDEYFVDLTTILSDEQLKKYEPYFMYIDEAVIEEIAILSKDVDNEVNVELPDPCKPEEMEKPIPVFIDITKCEKLQQNYDYTTEKPIFAFMVNAENIELSVEFLDYLMEKPESQ